MAENNEKFTPQQVKEIEEISRKTTRSYNKGFAFTDRKTTDTIPTDAFSVTNRQFVAGNGTFADRPKAVTGQRYFAIDLATNGQPTWYNGNIDKWVDSTGSVLGAGI